MCTNSNSSFDGREGRIVHLRFFCVRSNRNGRILLVVPFIIERKGARLLDLKAGVFLKLCSIEHKKFLMEHEHRK